jgi:GxxExxY protein
MSDEIFYREESYDIIGACREVHRELGCGFLEIVYREALAIEFRLRGIPYVREKPLPLYYKGQLLDPFYKPDFLCFGKIVVEVKARELMNTLDTAQAINYLKCTNFKLCLLVNFGNTDFKQQRVVY